MFNKFAKKLFLVFLAIAFWVLVFEAASFLISDDLKLFLPSPVAVFSALMRLSAAISFWKAVLLSLLRIFIGYVAGVLSGIVLGVITAKLKAIDVIISPALRVIRAVPVVSFIILAFLFIKVDILPVFICMLMVMPLIWQTVYDQLVNFDKSLNEMTRVFRITGFRKLIYVVIPTVADEVFSSMVNCVGLAWKSGIATEVLCAPAISIGKAILRSKNQINFDEVYALTIVVIALSIVFEYLVKYLYKKSRRKRYDKI